MILISTIWHTGTHSLMSLLDIERLERNKEWRMAHCSPDIADKIDEFTEVHTTYRDPLKVAASWANRDKLKSPVHCAEREWFEQWEAWARIAPIAKVHDCDTLPAKLNSFEDKYGLYPVLGKKAYYQKIPREWIEFARDCVQSCQSLPVRFTG